MGSVLEWMAGVTATVVSVGIVGLLGLFQKVSILWQQFTDHVKEYNKARDGHEQTHQRERDEWERDYQHLHAAITALRERMSDSITNEKLNQLRHEENRKTLSESKEETRQTLAELMKKMDRIEGKK